MLKRLPRRALTLLLVALACVGVAACAVYSIRATADAGAGIGARQVGAKGPLASGGTAGSSGLAGPGGPAGAAAPSNRLIVPDLLVLAPGPLTQRQRDAMSGHVAPRGHILFTDAGPVRVGARDNTCPWVSSRARSASIPPPTPLALPPCGAPSNR